jgi:hypothetical protein
MVDQTLVEEVARFEAGRDWAQFHTPGNLTQSISIEQQNCWNVSDGAPMRRWFE